MVSSKLRITQRVLIKLCGTQTKNRGKTVLGIWGSFMGRKGWEKTGQELSEYTVYMTLEKNKIY